MCLKQRWTGCWRPKRLSTTGMVETPLSRLQTTHYVEEVDWRRVMRQRNVFFELLEGALVERELERHPHALVVGVGRLLESVEQRVQAGPVFCAEVCAL